MFSPTTMITCPLFPGPPAIRQTLLLNSDFPPAAHLDINRLRIELRGRRRQLPGSCLGCYADKDGTVRTQEELLNGRRRLIRVVVLFKQNSAL